MIPRPSWARRIDPLVGPSDIRDSGADLTTDTVRKAFSTGVGIAGDTASSLEAGPLGAAVLIVLVPSVAADAGAGRGEPGEPVGRDCAETVDGSASSVLLIRRASHLRANPGEIAFPGGRIEPGESPLAAALREAEEEVALSPDAVEVLGELPSVLAARRDVPIVPFVAAARGPLELEANPEEVDYVLLVPLRELVAPGRYWQEKWGREGDPVWVMHFFDLGEDVIWGATARMLYEMFLRLLSRGSAG